MKRIKVGSGQYSEYLIKTNGLDIPTGDKKFDSIQKLKDAINNLSKKCRISTGGDYVGPNNEECIEYWVVYGETEIVNMYKYSLEVIY